MRSKNWEDKECKLVSRETGEELNINDVVITGRGDVFKIQGGRAPHKPSSTGRVYVTNVEEDWKGEYFPTVIDACWVTVNGRTNREVHTI